jgi:hypothetical protein
MATLPERSNTDHLRKQANELLRLYRNHNLGGRKEEYPQDITAFLLNE